MLLGCFLLNLAALGRDQGWRYRKCHKDHLHCFALISSPLVGRSWRMGWRAGRLCTALEVFASVWFGVPAVRLVVAQCSPAASLTDDLQLARLARAAAVAAWDWGGVALSSVKIWRSYRQHSVQCSQSPSLQAGLYLNPSIPMQKPRNMSDFSFNSWKAPKQHIPLLFPLKFIQIPVMDDCSQNKNRPMKSRSTSSFCWSGLVGIDGVWYSPLQLSYCEPWTGLNRARAQSGEQSQVTEQFREYNFPILKLVSHSYCSVAYWKSERILVTSSAVAVM